MQLSWQHFLGGVGLVSAAMLAWFSAIWLNLQGMNLWIFRACIFLFVLLIVGILIWWLQNRQKNKPAAHAHADGSDSATLDGGGDILSALHEAEARLGSSSQLPRGTKLARLPVILILGEAASGKTSIAVQSGLEPDLISGQIYQGTSVASTHVANLWFARKTVLIEMGGKVLGDASLWARMLNRLSPGKFTSIFSGKRVSPRVAVVCFDSEKLAKAKGPEEIVAYSRALRARLEQISQVLGISIPVYVLFTRADRIPYFSEFFRNLTDVELTQVLGATLPPAAVSATSVYAEQETKRIAAAFHSIFHSLAECRPSLLYRECAADKLPDIYEFPREFQKRIPIATQFLVDLCRPSHLRSGPFLRGFYFTGIRTVESFAPPAGTMIGTKTSLSPATGFSTATSLMRMDETSQTKGWQPDTQEGFTPESHKVTQWLFLSHIFSQLILQDRAALGASVASSKGNLWKCVLLASAGILFGFWLLALTVSYFGNRSLQQDVRQAAEGIVAIRHQDIGKASLEDLQRLDVARQLLAKLSQYQAFGAPWHLRWGLYSGANLYLDFRKLYFRGLANLLFTSTQAGMVDELRRLPSTVSPADEWQKTYETLKAYLITTSNPEKSTREFLVPVLTSRWENESKVGDQREALAQAQFVFYADELRIQNPLPTSADSFVVAQARRFLNSFSSGAQLLYQKMLTRVNLAVPQFSFSLKYPDARGVVADSKVVEGAFTEAGWRVMTDAISHPENYVGGDEWVLGTPPGSRGPSLISPQDIRNLYETDYRKQWRDFLNAATVRHFAGTQDESRQLEKLSGNRSPLLALLCEVSQNTAGASPEIGKAFQPVQEVVTPGLPPQSCRERLKQSTNDAYTSSLLAVKTCLDDYESLGQQSVVTPELRKAKLNECNTLSLQAGTAARQIVKTNDPEGQVDSTVIALLLAPTSPSREQKRALEGSAQFCAALASLQNEYPFNPTARREATPSEFNNFFKPMTGSLSKFIGLNKDSLDLQDSQYISKGGNISAGFLNVINVGAQIQRTLYSNNSAVPQFQFTLKARPPENFSSEIVMIDGQKMQVIGSNWASQAFKWPGNVGEAVLSLSTGGVPLNYVQYQGLWSIFHFFDNYSWFPTSNGFRLEAPLHGVGGQLVTTMDNRQVPVEFELESGGLPLFRRGYLASLKCSSH